MRRIQYKIDPTYNKKESLQVASILLITLLKTLRKIKEAGYTYDSTDFIFYPLNPLQIVKNGKLILVGSPKTKGIVDYIDEKFLKDLEKENLKVIREEFEE